MVPIEMGSEGAYYRVWKTVTFIYLFSFSYVFVCKPKIKNSVSSFLMRVSLHRRIQLSYSDEFLKRNRVSSKEFGKQIT
jgi:hypothetical protein